MDIIKYELSLLVLEVKLLYSWQSVNVAKPQLSSINSGNNLDCMYSYNVEIN